MPFLITPRLEWIYGGLIMAACYLRECVWQTIYTCWLFLATSLYTYLGDTIIDNCLLLIHIPKTLYISRELALLVCCHDDGTDIAGRSVNFWHPLPVVLGIGYELFILCLPCWELATTGMQLWGYNYLATKVFPPSVPPNIELPPLPPSILREVAFGIYIHEELYMVLNPLYTDDHYSGHLPKMTF